jgi:hypothetical protein
MLHALKGFFKNASPLTDVRFSPDRATIRATIRTTNTDGITITWDTRTGKDKSALSRPSFTVPTPFYQK